MGYARLESLKEFEKTYIFDKPAVQNVLVWPPVPCPMYYEKEVNQFLS